MFWNQFLSVNVDDGCLENEDACESSHRDDEDEHEARVEDHWGYENAGDVRREYVHGYAQV